MRKRGTVLRSNKVLMFILTLLLSWTLILLLASIFSCKRRENQKKTQNSEDSVAGTLETALADLDSDDTIVRIKAIKILGEHDEPESIAALTTLLGDKNQAIQEYAVINIAKIGEPALNSLIPLMGARDFTIRKNAVNAIMSVGEVAVEPLIASLTDKNRGVSLNSENLLAKLDPSWLSRESAVKAVPFLLRKFTDEDVMVRDKAMEAFVILGEPAVDLLIDALVDENWLISDYAGRSLVKIDLYWIRSEKARRAVPKLIAALKDKNIDVRQNASRALSRIGPQSVDGLIAVLTEGDWAFQKNIRWILNQIDEFWYMSDHAKKHVPSFIEALKSDNPGVRLGAVIALTKIKDERAVAPLIQILDDDFVFAKASAIDALKEMTGEDFGRDKSKWLSWFEARQR